MSTETPLRLARTTLPALLSTPAAARSFLRRTLAAWGLDPHRDTAELVMSELVTNAVKAAPHPAPPHADLRDAPLVTVELRATAHVLRICVEDTAPGHPTLRTAPTDAESGRGLFLVAALSTHWNTTPTPTGGKITWAELALAGSEHARPLPGSAVPRG